MPAFSHFPTDFSWFLCISMKGCHSFLHHHRSVDSTYKNLKNISDASSHYSHAFQSCLTNFSYISFHTWISYLWWSYLALNLSVLPLPLATIPVTFVAVPWESIFIPAGKIGRLSDWSILLWKYCRYSCWDHTSYPWVSSYWSELLSFYDQLLPSYSSVLPNTPAQL